MDCIWKLRLLIISKRIQAIVMASKSIRIRIVICWKFNGTMKRDYLHHRVP